MARNRAVLQLARVPWAEEPQWICGWHEGLPLVRRHQAPREVLATRRQLRARGRRPGGQDPVAVLITRHRPSGRRNFSSLWLVSAAVPVRPMTPARWAAVARALEARRTCRGCGEVGYVELPRADRLCEACRADVELLAPHSYLHDYLVGEPTLSAAEHAALADPAPVVIPLPRRELSAPVRVRALEESIR